MRQVALRSRDHPLIKDSIALSKAGGYDRARGLVMLEGEHLFAVAVERSPECVQTVFLCEGRWPWAGTIPRLPKAQIVSLPGTLFARLSRLPSPPAVIAILSLPAPSPPLTEGFVLALDAVQDPGNVGTLIRTAAAAGCDQVWVDRRSAGAWSAKTLRAAQGAQWLLPVLDGLDLAAALASFRGTRWGTLPRKDARWPVDSALDPRTWSGLGASRCLIVSNEGAGLSAELSPLIDRAIRIPMAKGVESLNVAIAGAMALYALAPEGRIRA